MSSIYEEYMRNVLGYEPIRYRDTYETQYNDYMSYTNLKTPQPIEANVENAKLESCYPDIYNLVYPMIKKACEQNHRSLNSDLIEELTKEIYQAIEDDSLNENRVTESKNNMSRTTDMKTNIVPRNIDDKNILKKQDIKEREDRQITNQGLQDLIKILLIRELINNSGFRPRPPKPPTPPPPRPGRLPRPPIEPRPPFNRYIYENDFDIYEY